MITSIESIEKEMAAEVIKARKAFINGRKAVICVTGSEFVYLSFAKVLKGSFDCPTYEGIKLVIKDE